jgi:hypothetical protein
MSLVLSMALAATSWIVIAPVANMHRSPDAGAAVTSQAIYSTEVGIREKTSGWTLVKTPDGYTGWLESRLLVKRKGHYALTGRVAIVDSLFANLYREADITVQRPLLTLPYESRLEVVAEPEAEDRRWIEVRLPDQQSAWIQRGDVRFGDEPLDVDSLIALARRFVGLPYLWGGVSTFGYDCSGFTQMLCRRRGVQIPRDADPQAAWEGMLVIDRSDLSPGDLLYFGDDGEITHTGLYLGGGEFIHATAWKLPRVQISRLELPHWSGRLMGCRRLRKDAQ